MAHAIKALLKEFVRVERVIRESMYDWFLQKTVWRIGNVCKKGILCSFLYVKIGNLSNSSSIWEYHAIGEETPFTKRTVEHDSNPFEYKVSAANPVMTSEQASV